MLLRLLLLIRGATHYGWILAIARMQILVDLEPVKLKLVPELFTLLIHDITHTRITVLLWPYVFVPLVFVIVIR